MSPRIALLAAFIIGIMCYGGAARSASAPADMLPLAAIKSSGVAWKEGENYEVLAPPSAPTPASGKVEILEFFQYGCPHCYTMEPHMVLWKRMYGNLATVTRVPVTFRPLLRSLARLYYTLEAVGRIDAPHGFERVVEPRKRAQQRAERDGHTRNRCEISVHALPQHHMRLHGVTVRTPILEELEDLHFARRRRRGGRRREDFVVLAFFPCDAGRLDRRERQHVRRRARAARRASVTHDADNECSEQSDSGAHSHTSLYC